MKELNDYITHIPDFPKKGVLFHDITSLLNDKDGLKLAVDMLIQKLKDVDFDIVVGIDSRGFIFGTPVAYELGKAFVPARKKGKLPRETVSQTYALEYGEATIEIHTDSIKKGQKVIILDDLVATGGTAYAVAKLVEKLGGEIVKIGFVIELDSEFHPKEKFKDYDMFSLIKY